MSWKIFIKKISKLFWYEIVSQKWSHVKLKHLNWCSLIVPNHKEIKKWTFNSILDLIAEDTGNTKKEVFMKL